MPPPPEPRDRLLARIRARLGEANLASAVYGEILLLSVLAAEGDGVAPETVLAGVLASQLVFWLAHAYSETISRQLSDDDPIDRAGIGLVLEHEWPIVQAAGPTAVLMALAILDVLDTATAIDVASGLAVVSLFGFGYAAGRRSRDTRRGQVLAGLLSGALGLAIVALKLATH
jgi:hypothetical protein